MIARKTPKSLVGCTRTCPGSPHQGAVAAAVSLLAAGMASTPLLAQSVGAAAEVAAQVPIAAQVVVTAKGYRSSEAETPTSIVVLTRDELDRRDAVLPGDALRGEPGVAIASDGAQGQNPVLRGLRRESIVLLVDGMRLNSAQPQGAVASFMSLALADRLEVVKGPASVLYGTGALGGVVHVMLPQARFDDGVRLRTSLGAGSADESVRAAAVANVGLGDHAVMFGVAGLRAHDYDSPAGTVPRTGYDSASWIGQYRMRLDARQQWWLSLQRHVDDDVWYPGSTKPLANPALGTSTIHSPRQQRELGELGYRAQRWLGTPMDLDARIWRQRMQRQIWSRANGLGRDIAQTQVAFETDGIDVRADGLLLPAHRFSVGLSGWTMRASPQRLLASPTPMSPLVRNNPFDAGRLEAIGAFVQDDVRVGPLSVLAGLRLDRVEGRAASMGNGAVTTGLSRRDEAASGSLGLVWTWLPLVRPYAQVSRGFRAGEMRERFESSPRGDGYFYVGNPQIAPEKATQIEAGIKGQTAVWSWSAATYLNRITNYITGRPTGGTQGGLPVKATVNLGEVTLRGLEAQARWRVASGHVLRTQLSVLRATNEDLNEPLFQSPADELTLGWAGEIARQWSADAAVRLVRRQDRVATRFSLGSENATPGYATADIGLAWRPRRTQTLRVALRNLADKTYHEHLSEGISGQEIAAPGRSLSISWQGSFQ